MTREAKEELRRRILAWRETLDPKRAAAWSAAVAGYLCGMPEYQGAKTILAYFSFRNEVATPPLIARGLRAGKRVCLPEVLPDGRRLVPRLLPSADVWGSPLLTPADFAAAGLVRGPMGLWQPDRARCPAVAPREIDLVLIPGVAFDRRGHRLGFGQGYYDRFLPSLPASACRVGLAFSGQVVEAVPADPWDVPVHFLVTEEGVIC